MKPGRRIADAGDRVDDRVLALVVEVVDHADALVALIDEEQVARRGSRTPCGGWFTRASFAAQLSRSAVGGEEAGAATDEHAHAPVSWLITRILWLCHAVKMMSPFGNS